MAQQMHKPYETSPFAAGSSQNVNIQPPPHPAERPPFQPMVPEYPPELVDSRRRSSSSTPFPQRQNTMTDSFQAQSMPQQLEHAAHGSPMYPLARQPPNITGNPSNPQAGIVPQPQPAASRRPDLTVSPYQQYPTPPLEQTATPRSVPGDWHQPSNERTISQDDSVIRQAFSGSNPEIAHASRMEPKVEIIPEGSNPFSDVYLQLEQRKKNTSRPPSRHSSVSDISSSNLRDPTQRPQANDPAHSWPARSPSVGLNAGSNEIHSGFRSPLPPNSSHHPSSQFTNISVPRNDLPQNNTDGSNSFNRLSQMDVRSEAPRPPFNSSSYNFQSELGSPTSVASYSTQPFDKTDSHNQTYANSANSLVSAQTRSELHQPHSSLPISAVQQSQAFVNPTSTTNNQWTSTVTTQTKVDRQNFSQHTVESLLPTSRPISSDGSSGLISSDALHPRPVGQYVSETATHPNRNMQPPPYDASAFQNNRVSRPSNSVAEISYPQQSSVSVASVSEAPNINVAHQTHQMTHPVQAGSHLENTRYIPNTAAPYGPSMNDQPPQLPTVPSVPFDGITPSQQKALEKKQKLFERRRKKLEAQQKRKVGEVKKGRRPKAPGEKKQPRKLKGRPPKSQFIPVNRLITDDKNLKLPLCEPEVHLLYPLVQPYGSGFSNGETVLVGAFGQAIVQGTPDFYTQFPSPDPPVTSSNPPTPPTSLPPSPRAINQSLQESLRMNPIEGIFDDAVPIEKKKNAYYSDENKMTANERASFCTTGDITSLSKPHGIQDDNVSITITLPADGKRTPAETVSAVSNLLGVPEPPRFHISEGEQSKDEYDMDENSKISNLEPEATSIGNEKDLRLQHLLRNGTLHHSGDVAQGGSHGPFCRHCDITIQGYGFLAVPKDNILIGDDIMNIDGISYKRTPIVPGQQIHDAFCSYLCLKSFNSLTKSNGNIALSLDQHNFYSSELIDPVKSVIPVSVGETTSMHSTTLLGDMDLRGSEQAPALSPTASVHIKRKSMGQQFEVSKEISFCFHLLHN